MVFVMENPIKIKIDDLEIFGGIPISGNLHRINWV
jgi:hypothetical protein